jgi:diacylglycerol kinase (ATP)
MLGSGTIGPIRVRWTESMALSHPSPETSTPYTPLCGTSPNRWFSLRAALAGMRFVIFTQPNARIELAAGLVVVVLGWWLRVSATEWAVLGLSVFLVLALEAVNTAVEAVVDLVSPQYHPLAKIAKDAAAGAMIFAVLGTVCVGLGVFGPRLWALLVGG